MAKLYELNKQIEEILANIIDPETGEIMEGTDDKFFLLETLTDKRDEIIEYLVRKCKKTQYLASSVDEQIKDLQKHKDRLKKQYDGLVKVIDRECQGKKQDFGFAVVSYRKSSSVILDDEETVKDWCEKNGQDQIVKVKTTTTLDKTELKKVMMNEFVPGAHIETRNNCSVK